MMIADDNSLVMNHQDKIYIQRVIRKLSYILNSILSQLSMTHNVLENGDVVC